MGILNSFYIVGQSCANRDNAITRYDHSFDMAFEVDAASGDIIDFSCSHTLDMTERFLGKMFIGQNFLSIEEWLEKELKHHYAGSARKVILISYLDARKRYLEILKIK